MKKYFAFFVLLLCGLFAVGVSAADSVVYVADGGTGDGTSAATPLGSLTDAYNALGSDRYVEKGDYLRLQYMQLSYSLSNKVCKDLGISSLRFNASAQNLFCLTKYTGVDPEVSYGAWGVCYDHSKTPRAKSFTVGINLGF